MKQFAKICLLVALVLLVTGIVALAQSDTGRVVGTVSDPTGAAIPGATVTVTNTGTNQKFITQSQADGNFVVTALQPGNYRVEARKEAFKTESAKISLDISQVQRINFKLQLGSAAETVNVTDEVPLVETTTSTAGEVIQGRQVVELPLNGRNFTQLATIAPGVTRGSYSDQASGSSSQSETWRNSSSGGAALSVNGLRPQANSYQMDGVVDTENLVNTVIILPALEDIAEFRMTTANAPAELGTPSTVQVSTKSGTNQIHGSEYWYRRGGGNAIPWGYTSAPPFSRQQFGSTLSGPLWKNHVFGFVDYQGYRLKVPNSVDLTHVPTDLMRQGNFTEYLSSVSPSGTSTATSLPYSGLPGCTAAMASDPAAFTSGKGYIFNPATCLPFGWDTVNHVPGTGINIIPTGNQNSVGLAYLKAFPTSNITGANPAILDNNFRSTRQKVTNQDDYDARLDFVVTKKDTIFARYSMGQDLYQVTDRLQDGSHDLPSGYGSGLNPQHPRQLAVGYTRILSNSVVNEFRYSYSRPYFGYQQPGFGVNQATNLGIPNANTSPLLGGMPLIGGWKGEIEYVGDYGPYVVVQKFNQFADTLSWTRKNHTLKFGANIIHKDVNFSQANVAKGYFWIDDNNEPQYSGFPGQYSGFGTFTGNEISELLGGFMAAYQIGAFNGYYKTRNWENSFFAQDDWRVTRKLTFNYGIRYDVLTWPYEANNKQSNFDPTSGTLIEAGTPGYPRALVNTPMNNVAPRVGFAYDVKGDGKMVIRGGYGVFYYQERGGVDTQLSNNPDYNGSQTYYACPTLTTCGSGYRATLSGLAPNGSTNPNSSVANGSLPVGQITFDPASLTSGTNVIYYKRQTPDSNVQQWNFQIEQAISKNTSANLAYVGTHMSHLGTSFNANGASIISGSKWFPNLGSISEYGMVGTGNYSGLQARLNRKMSNGLQYTVSYTWSHTLDNVGGALSNGASTIYMGDGGDPLLKYSHGNSNTDMRHVLVGSMMYELPFGKHHQFLHNIPTALDYVIGGWQWSNIVTLARGVPFNVTINGVLPDYNGGCSIGRSNNQWLTCPTGAFTSPAGLVGNLARNYFYGPGTRTWDTTLSKNFTVYKVKTDFRVALYNLLNTPQFQSPDGGVTDGNFGKLTSTRTESSRELELVLRVSF